MTSARAVDLADGRESVLALRASIARVVIDLMNEVGRRAQEAHADGQPVAPTSHRAAALLRESSVLLSLLALLERKDAVDARTGHLTIPSWAVPAVGALAWDRATASAAPDVQTFWADLAAVAQNAQLGDASTAG